LNVESSRSYIIRCQDGIYPRAIPITISKHGLVVVTGGISSKLGCRPSSSNPGTCHVVIGSSNVDLESHIIPPTSVGIPKWDKACWATRSNYNCRCTTSVCSVEQICLPIHLNLSERGIVKAGVVGSRPSSNSVVRVRQWQRVGGDEVEEDILGEPT